METIERIYLTDILLFSTFSLIQNTFQVDVKKYQPNHLISKKMEAFPQLSPTNFFLFRILKVSCDRT